jgi:hypothetical protein
MVLGPGFYEFSFPSHLYGSFAAVKRTKMNGSDKDLSKPSRSAMAFDFVSKLVLDFMVIFVPTLACLTVCLSLATLVPQLLAALANLFCKDYIPR